MKRNQLLLFLGLCAAGLLSGYAGKRLTSPHPAATSSEQASAQESASAGANSESGGAMPSSDGKRRAIEGSRLHSTETLESLKDAEGPDLYGKLALWMVDASEEDINAYWQHYRGKKDRNNDINDLIFINWTRINPQGATAAAKGTEDEHYAWWAWACHDPQKALAEAIANNPDRVNNVTWGIGEFHPDWLREHFDELPESARDNALSGMSKWDDGEKPLETLKFLKDHGRGVHPGIFKVLIRKDPWAAYDWLKENGVGETRYYDSGGSSDMMGTFVKMVGEENPDVLQRIADQAPAGAMKRKMESAIFDSLLKTDPDAAITQAKETKGPAIATERLAKLGVNFAQTDPAKAFEMAEAIFKINPSAVGYGNSIEYENGGSYWGATDEGMNQLVSILLAKDPGRLMAIAKPASGGIPGESSFSRIGSKWAEQDITGYSTWVNEQTEPMVREPAAMIVIQRLQNDQQYGDALQWAMSLRESRDSYVSGLFQQWNRTNPVEAGQWLESADLPDEEVERLEKFKNHNP